VVKKEQRGDTSMSTGEDYGKGKADLGAGKNKREDTVAVLSEQMGARVQLWVGGRDRPHG